MKFFAPESFWFLSVLPIVVIFYLLKRKRVVRLVSSTLLWQRFLSETQANAPFQRLRHNWLLLLQLLLLLIVIFGLVRPYIPSRAKPSRLRVLILDASASMQSTDETPSRFERARQEALKWVDGLEDENKIVVLQAAGNTEVKQSATSEKAALRRAILSCQAVDAPTRLGEAFKLAETLIRNEEDSEIHLFSDGAVPGVDDIENKALPVVYHMVGKTNQIRNAGIVKLDVRGNPTNANQRAVFVSVGNFFPEREHAELELYLDGKLVEGKAVELPSRETTSHIFVTEQQRDGVFTVKLNTRDDLAADNEASIYSQIPRSINVLLVSDGRSYIEKALRVIPLVALKVQASLAQVPSETDLIVVDGVNPVAWPRDKNILAIRSYDTNWFSNVTPVETPAIVNWRTTHPVLRYVNFDNVTILKSLAVRAQDWGVSLLDSPQAGLMVAGERERQRIVWIGFDLAETDWPLIISFPIFVSNAIDWLNPASAAMQQQLIRAGDPFRMPLADGVSAVEVTSPSGQKESRPVEPGRHEFIYGNTFHHGVYHVKAGTNETVFCVNLMNAAESDITPRAELPFSSMNSVKATSLRQANMELWRWIVLGGLVVLLFEWWFYHRRTA